MAADHHRRLDAHDGRVQKHQFQIRTFFDTRLVYSFDRLRLPDTAASDKRNIYYEMSRVVTPLDPQDLPVPGTLYLLGLGLLGLAGVGKSARLRQG